MTFTADHNPPDEVIEFVDRAWPGPGHIAWRQLAVDGSDRSFWRVARRGESLVVVDHPRGREADRGGVSENFSYLAVARHFAGLGLPAPRILALDEPGGRFLVTDLGDRRLMDAALDCQGDPESLADLYDSVIDLLAEMQAQATAGFDPAWCYDTASFFKEFFREREADYFAERFLADYQGLDFDRQRLGAEFDHLAERAVTGPGPCFVHRDFQSRNIMIRPTGPAMVDFQGARLGPPAYDLAALVLDPYVDLDWPVKLKLINKYVESAKGRVWDDEAAFLGAYPVVALFRAMQTLGAFGFLTLVKGRTHFEGYIPAGVANLNRLLQIKAFDDCPALRDLGRRAQDALGERAR